MKRLVFAVILGLFAVGVAACSSGSSTMPASGIAGHILCGLPAGLSSSTAVLVYPAPGSTGIPSTLGQIIVASTVGFPNTWDVLVQGSTVVSRGASFGSASPPFPSPTAAPTFANPIYQGSPIATGTLASGGVTYTVWANSLPGLICEPTAYLGSFTTL